MGQRFKFSLHLNLLSASHFESLNNIPVKKVVHSVSYIFRKGKEKIVPRSIVFLLHGANNDKGEAVSWFQFCQYLVCVVYLLCGYSHNQNKQLHYNNESNYSAISLSLILKTKGKNLGRYTKYSGGELEGEEQRDDPNYLIAFSFHCKTKLDCVRALEKSWELFQRGIPNCILRAGEKCWREKLM